MSQQNTNHVGIGVPGLLGVMFVGLKLAHVIDWSWWWVTVPFWGWVPLLLVILVIYGAIRWVKP